MKSLKLSCLSLFATVFFVTKIFAADDMAAGLILQSFQNSCSSSGRWTEAALQQNRLMVGVIDTLKDQDPCRPFAGKLAVIQNTSSQIEKLLTDPSFSDYRIAEEKLQNLMLALKGAPTPAIIEELGKQIVSAQVSLAEKRAKYQVAKDQAGKDQYERATLALSQYVQGLLQESGGLSSCLRSSPSAAVQLATNLASFGGSFISPVYGAGAAVIGQIINTAVEYFRNNHREKTLYKLHSALFPAAMTCGLEAMTELYCQANDAFSLLEIQVNNPLPGTTIHPVWSDLDVIRRQLPILNYWLLQVRNGVTPSNPMEAERQNQIWRKVQSLQNRNRSVQGQLNYTGDLYNHAGSAAEKVNLLVSFIVSLTKTLVDNQNPSPFMDLTTDSYTMACFLSQGLSGTCPRPSSNNQSTDSYVRDNFANTFNGIQKLIDNWNEVFEAVERQVNNEFNQSIAMDPSAILATAYEKNKEKISPVSATEKTIVFLERLKSTTNPAMVQRKILIEETLTILRQFLVAINSEAVRDPKDQIREVFTLFQLGQNSKFIYDRIANFVLWDLTDLLHSGNYPQDAREILISGAADIRTRLEASGVTKDSVESDLNTARTLAEGNMDAFNDFFKDSMKTTLQYLSEKARASGEPATGTNRPFNQSLARLCVLKLITHREWPKEIPWELCQDAVLYSVYDTTEIPLRIVLRDLKAAVVGMPVSERLCQYHKFIRAGRIAEIMDGTSAIPLYLRRHYQREPFDFNKLLNL